MDFDEHEGREWLSAQLRRLVQLYGVDGFKLDGGDAELFAQPAMLTGSVAAAVDGHAQAGRPSVAPIRPRVPAERIP